MGASAIVVVTGPAGAGKTTVSRLLASRYEPVACVLETDWWWTTIVKGCLSPWLPAAHEQNRTIVRSYSAAAAAMAAGGYPVVLDGVVGPWNLDLVQAAAAAVNVDLHYVVLRPSLDLTLRRAMGRLGEERVPGHPALVDEGPIRQLWTEFSELEHYEAHVIDTGDSDAPETVGAIWAMLNSDRLRLTPTGKAAGVGNPGRVR